MQTDRKTRTYLVKILDFNYQASFECLQFRYFTYEVIASHEKNALKKARELYMKGQKALQTEELPILLKLVSIIPSIHAY